MSGTPAPSFAETFRVADLRRVGPQTNRLVSNLDRDRGRRERRYSQAPLPLLGETNVLLLNHPAESQATRFSSRPEGYIELSEGKSQAV